MVANKWKKIVWGHWVQWVFLPKENDVEQIGKWLIFYYDSYLENITNKLKKIIANGKILSYVFKHVVTEKEVNKEWLRKKIKKVNNDLNSSDIIKKILIKELNNIYKKSIEKGGVICIYTHLNKDTSKFKEQEQIITKELNLKKKLIFKLNSKTEQESKERIKKANEKALRFLKLNLKK